ncbi:hypothetical protein J7400_20995 [Shimia sp. R9_2]|nr:hypothetical protein [Shimia sp. R9_2]
MLTQGGVHCSPKENKGPSFEFQFYGSGITIFVIVALQLTLGIKNVMDRETAQVEKPGNIQECECHPPFKNKPSYKIQQMGKRILNLTTPN